MEGPEITFLFQFGNIRDMVIVPACELTLKLLKDRACDFINLKVNNYLKIIRNFRLIYIIFLNSIK